MMMLSNSLHNGPTRLELSIRQHSYRRWADGIGRLCAAALAAKSANVRGPAGRVPHGNAPAKSADRYDATDMPKGRRTSPVVAVFDF